MNAFGMKSLSKSIAQQLAIPHLPADHQRTLKLADGGVGSDGVLRTVSYSSQVIATIFLLTFDETQFQSVQSWTSSVSA